MKNILIFIVLLIMADTFVVFTYHHFNPTVDEQHHHTNLHEHGHDGKIKTDSQYDFNLGKKTKQPWGADLFCTEFPEQCGMN